MTTPNMHAVAVSACIREKQLHESIQVCLDMCAA